MTWDVRLNAKAEGMLADVADRRIREKIAERISGLARDPEKQGKPLGDELAGYRSVRAAGQRCRIVYRIERTAVVVVVIALGLRRAGDRRDIYELAQRLVRLGLAERPRRYGAKRRVRRLRPGPGRSSRRSVRGSPAS